MPVDALSTSSHSDTPTRRYAAPSSQAGAADHAPSLAMR